MTVFAFVNRGEQNEAVIQWAVWAASRLNQSLTLVAESDADDRDPLLDFDAYQHLDARQDAFSELLKPSPNEVPPSDLAAVELAQRCARKAREMGAASVRTTTYDSLEWFAENLTDSEDLLVVARHPNADTSSRKWDERFLHIHRRMILSVPVKFCDVESWMFAIDGKSTSGRAVEYLSKNKLLQDLPGMAVIVGTEHKYRTRFRDAVAHLRGVGHAITPFELQGSADDVLSAILTVAPSDLLVLGSYDQGRVRSIIERSTTSRLLKDFHGPVLIARG